MARTKRAQVLMEPNEYERLEALAREKGVAVAELIREAVRERYFVGVEERRRAVQEILSLRLRLPEWSELEAEVAEEHGHRLS